MSSQMDTSNGFEALNLPATLLRALSDVGYETPTPIQAEAIPCLLEGRDLVGHAPTGTGKTAAFALPLLTRVDVSNRQVQALILTPTRELAIQVAEAFQRYAAHVPGFHVMPIYGGQGYDIQLRQLRRGVHIVVGTPGRVMDHMRRGSLSLAGLQTLVLDEADEMLRMGFIEDVEWVLEQAPKERQLVLFSATMPPEVERIARAHLHDPLDISIKAKTATAETIRQRYWLVGGLHKLDALTRILEVEPFDAMLIFVRTKIATLELAERLEARGYSAAALNGDMAQNHREQMVNRFKAGSLDILIATDVAARGLDVDRISHVVNYDIPYDTESYIHRIGRTGRAGRLGDAILFVAAREQRMLAAIERATRQRITRLELPSAEAVTQSRVTKFKQRIVEKLESADLAFMRNILEQFQQEHAVTPLDIAAALGILALGNKTLAMPPDASRSRRPAESLDQRDFRSDDRRESRGDNRHDRGSVDRNEQRDDHRRDDSRRNDRSPDRNFDRPSDRHGDRGDSPPRMARKASRLAAGDSDRYRIEVGSEHGVAPGNLVGAIANEAGLDSGQIGKIEIHADHSVVELPTGMPKAIFNDLSNAWVCGRQLRLSLLDANGAISTARAFEPKKHRDNHREKRAGAGERSAAPATPFAAARFKDKSKNKDKPEKDKGKRKKDRKSNAS